MKRDADIRVSFALRARAHTTCGLGTRLVTEVNSNLSEPHIDEFAVNFLYIYICRTSCRKSLPALILCVLTSFVN